MAGRRSTADGGQWGGLPAASHRSRPCNSHSRTRTLAQVHDQPRKGAIHLVEWPAFDPIILVTILANCVTMAWVSPLDPPGTWKVGFVDTCEWVYLAVFTIEMLAKIVAYGFAFNEHAYLRDAWCQVRAPVLSSRVYPDAGPRPCPPRHARSRPLLP